MNRITKTILSAFFAVLLLFGTLPVFSAAEEDVLFELDSRRNMAITVKYENASPEVSFIAPNGDEYGAEAIAEGKMELHDSGSVLYFRIPNAMAGKWKIVYDKKNNSTIEVTCAPYAEAINIDSFTYKQGDRDHELDTTFTVSYADSDDYYNYIIWAAVTENGSVVGQTKLREGRARAGKESEVTVNLSSLTSYSNYSLMLEVYMDVGGAEVFDTLVAEDTFSYTDPNAPEALEGFNVEIGVTDNYVRLDWEEYAVYCKGYIVVIYAEGKDEPVYAAELESDVRSTEVMVDLSAPSITCEIAYKVSNGKISEYASKKIDLAAAKALTFNCDEVTSAAEGKVEYDFTAYQGPILTTIDVNGNIEEALPEGKGSFSLKLDEFDNDIKITWQVSDYVRFTVSAQVYSDRTAPVLLLYEMTDKIITEDSNFILTGSTNPGCTVTIGDKSAEVDENGLFTVTLDLADGMNEFTVTSTSKTGNSSKQVISVEKLAPVVNTANAKGALATVLSYLPLIISFVFAAAVCIFTFINTRYYGKKKDKTGKPRALLASTRNICIFIGSIALICAVVFTVMTIKSSAALNSTEFLDTATESVSSAYEMIEARDTWRLCMIVSFIVLAVSAGVAVLCGWLGSEKHAEAVKKAKAAAAAKPAYKPTVPKASPTTATQNAHKYCPKCGAKLPVQAQFCGKCGHKF